MVSRHFINRLQLHGPSLTWSSNSELLMAAPWRSLCRCIAYSIVRIEARLLSASRIGSNMMVMDCMANDPSSSVTALRMLLSLFPRNRRKSSNGVTRSAARLSSLVSE